MIDGSSTQLTRGFGQFLDFNGELSLDPDYPDDKVRKKLVCFMSFEAK